MEENNNEVTAAGNTMPRVGDKVQVIVDGRGHRAIATLVGFEEGTGLPIVLRINGARETYAKDRVSLHARAETVVGLPIADWPAVKHSGRPEIVEAMWSAQEKVTEAIRAVDAASDALNMVNVKLFTGAVSAYDQTMGGKFAKEASRSHSVWTSLLNVQHRVEKMRREYTRVNKGRGNPVITKG